MEKLTIQPIRLVKDFTKLMLLACLWGFLFSCDEMTDNYQQYLEGGEIIYPGKADSVKVFPGKYRIGLSWLLLSDPSITSSVIFWNNGQDSTLIPVERTSGIDTVSIILDNLSELPYTFNIITMDGKGNKSVNTEVIGNVYGDIYRNSLLNRAISELQYSEQNGLNIVWANADEGALSEKIIYTKNDGKMDTIICQADDESVLLSDYDPSTDFGYSTAFIPDSMAIDTFMTAMEIVNPDIKKEEKQVNRSLFSLYELPGDYSVSHTSTSIASLIWTNDLGATNGTTYISLVDGHVMPQWLTIDLGKNYELTKFKLYQRGGTGSAANRLYAGGNLKQFEIWGAIEPDENYNPDEHSGDFGETWELLQTCVVLRPSGDVKGTSSTRNDNTEEDINAAIAGHEYSLNNSGKKYRYIRIKAIENWDYADRAYVNIASIDLQAIQY